MTKKIVERVAENLGWNVHWDTQSNEKIVTFSQYSPAGEDFSFDILWDNLGEIARQVFVEYSNFDVDEHVEMWLHARQNGMSGIPCARELVKDAYAIEKMLEELADALRDAQKDSKRKTT